MLINLPFGLTPRHYQRDLNKALFIDGYKRNIQVLHRRAGKTLNCLNVILMAAMMRPGMYYYCFPTLPNAKKAFWRATDNEGKPFLDYIPPQLLDGRPRESDMTIKLINRAIINMVSLEKFDRIRGSNPFGVIFDEFAEVHPMAWPTISPALKNNGGWVVFIFTPKGKNHAYDLYNFGLKNDWFVQRLGVDQTFKNDGTPVFTAAQVQQERDEGMPEEMILQEYYCSFDAPLVGAYYSEQIREARQEGRILNLLIDKKYPVYTFWDIGETDSTAIWFIQHYEGKFYFINYYENSQKKIDHYVNYINAFAERHGIKYAGHFFPQDVKKANLFNPYSNEQILQRAQLNFTRLPMTKSTIDEIQLARQLFKHCYFHAENCEMGIRCLTEYQKTWDTQKKIFSDKPLHNWASHGADAFRYFAKYFNKFANNGPSFIQTRY